jgi:hypothetical protein
MAGMPIKLNIQKNSNTPKVYVFITCTHNFIMPLETLAKMYNV